MRNRQIFCNAKGLSSDNDNAMGVESSFTLSYRLGAILLFFLPETKYTTVNVGYCDLWQYFGQMTLSQQWLDIRLALYYMSLYKLFVNVTDISKPQCSMQANLHLRKLAPSTFSVFKWSKKGYFHYGGGRENFHYFCFTWIYWRISNVFIEIWVLACQLWWILRL